MARKTPNEMDTAPLIQTTTLTDPGAAAITTAILDNNSAVLITTTTYGTAQVLGTPTKTSEVKRFTVINNDTSTHPIRVNSTIIAPGTTKYFIWDGSAWDGDDGDVEGLELLRLSSSNRYFIPQAVNATIVSTSGSVANRGYFMPYITRQEITIVSLNMNWTVGFAGSSIIMGLYGSDSTDLPTTLLGGSGLISTAAASGNGTYTFPTPIIVKPNTTIWTFFACDSSSVTVNFITAATIKAVLPISLGNTAINSYLRTSMGTFSVPNPAPAIGSYTISIGAIPKVSLEIN